MTRRVVITGLGPLSTIGVGPDAFAAGLRAGKSNSGPIRSFDASGFPHNIANELGDVHPSDYVKNVDPEAWGPASLAAAAVARLAADDAGLDRAELRRGRAGSVFGTTGGETRLHEDAYRKWLDEGTAAEFGDLVQKIPAYRIAVAANRELGIDGEAVTLATACSASNYAIGYAYDAIAGGDSDYMIAGGSEAMCAFAVAGFYRLGALAKDVCTPFDANRKGILIGEGSSALLLESLDSALARDARIYAEVLGYGLNCDANHMVSPLAASIAECTRRAHKNAGVKQEEIDYICAHGTGTPSNDTAEIAAMREVFGDELPPMSSIKSMLGHSMGAASGFGAIASCLAIQDGFIPPTINLTTLDPNFAGVDVVPNTSRSADVRIVQNNGFAFGGNNAITIFGRYE
ncbi:beta-ketoacyl-[acyl-carrier-protein] synthase family protein [Streptomyces sp. NPDC056347]|uniref:beta-ketoacyl-[acyl-carrier-protein] synthase family protein n=1 Tax=unclassified Streptomyces TaxID=2593676 RepID=UPI0035DFE175